MPKVFEDIVYTLTAVEVPTTHGCDGCAFISHCDSFPPCHTWLEDEQRYYDCIWIVKEGADINGNS